MPDARWRPRALTRLREDSYAESTGRFTDLGGAVACMLKDCGFWSSDAQATIFDEEATP